MRKKFTDDDEDKESKKEQRQKEMEQCDMIETLDKDDKDYKILSIFCMIDNDNSEDEDPSDRRLKDRRTPRIALHRHCQSSFIYLFNSGNKQALLNCCGVDHKVFCDLLHLF
eukprot:jgi/Psemu1/17710/gm1.17710_g